MELLPWLTALVHIQHAADLVALVIFLITPKAGRKNFQIIGIILAAIFFIEIGTSIAVTLHVNPNPIGLIYGVFIVPAFYFFYTGKISSGKIRIRFLLLTISYLLFASINIIFFDGFMIIPSATLVLMCIILVIFSSVYFGVLANELPRQVYVRLPIFWINCAVATYYAILLPIHLFTDYVYITLKLSIIPLWIVHNFVGILYYIFIAIGLWRNRSLYMRQSSLKA